MPSIPGAFANAASSSASVASPGATFLSDDDFSGGVGLSSAVFPAAAVVLPPVSEESFNVPSANKTLPSCAASNLAIKRLSSPTGSSPVSSISPTIYLILSIDSKINVT